MNTPKKLQYRKHTTQTVFIKLLWKCMFFVACSISSSTAQQNANYLETFDTVSTLNELITPIKWHAINFVPVSSNILEISNSRFLSASHSLKAFAVPSDTLISKASIERKGYDFVEGDTIFIQASFYFEPDADLNEIYLMDIECEQCYSQAPGPRLKVSNGFISIDRGKIGFTGSFKENKRSIRTGEWFRISWYMILGKNSKGSTKVFLNGQEVMDTTGTNIPDRVIFSANGVTLSAEKLDRFEVGLTANSSSKAALLYVDDVSMGKVEAVNRITPYRQVLKMEPANHPCNRVINSIYNRAGMTSGAIGLKNISYYDIHGRRIRMAGESTRGKGIYIAGFLNE